MYMGIWCSVEHTHFFYSMLCLCKFFTSFVLCASPLLFSIWCTLLNQFHSSFFSVVCTCFLALWHFQPVELEYICIKILLILLKFKGVAKGKVTTTPWTLFTECVMNNEVRLEPELSFIKLKLLWLHLGKIIVVHVDDRVKITLQKNSIQYSVHQEPTSCWTSIVVINVMMSTALSQCANYNFTKNSRIVFHCPITQFPSLYTVIMYWIETLDHVISQE